MKRIIAILMILSMTVVFFGCTTNTDSKFIVGFDAEFPPYGFLQDGEYVGFDLDLAQEVCKRNGWTYEAKPIAWTAKDTELGSSAIDCIWNGFTINGREDEYTWTKPYIDNSQVIVVRADSNIKTYADLAGKKLATQEDSSAYKALTDNDEDSDNSKNLNMVESLDEFIQTPDYLSAFMNLDGKAIDAIAIDIGVAKYEIEKRGSDNYIILEEQISKEQYGVGFKLGNTELRDKVESTLFEMLDDGTLLRIAEEWDVDEMLCLTKD